MKGKAKAVEFENSPYTINVKGRHVLVTDAMKQYALEKVAKIERFSDRIIEVNITMDIQKLNHRIDIDLKVGNLYIRSHAVTGDMYASIDAAVDRLKRQIRRYKKRIHDHHAKSVAEVDMNVNVIRPSRDLLIEINEEIEEANHERELQRFNHEVVSRETRSCKTLTLEEAMMRLELSQDQFLVYRSEEDRKIKVLYVRNDGNVGLIEPEG